MLDPYYSTEFLVDRVYERLEQIGKKQQLKLPKPEVVAQNRKTFFSNFRRICEVLNRKEEEVKKYFDEELQEECTIDGNGTLVIPKTFRPENIQSILKKYIEAHVLCKQCKSPHTHPVKENRILFMQCDSCLSKIALQH